MADILIVDDDKFLADMLAGQMVASNHTATCVHTLQDGLAEVRGGSFDVVLLDVQLPDGNGLDEVGYFKHARSEPEIIIITGQGEADGAEKAIVSGAWCYIEKPHVIRELSLHLTRALQYRQEKRKVFEVPVALKRKNIIGSSRAISECLDQVARAASSDVSVLVNGATGTGKELFAKAIHENSARADKNFVVVDCAALPESLIESTLFGHVKGAFTNADRDQDGLVKHADGGTLFLDEVGELPLAMQKTFLRLLQEHEYRPIGSSRQLYSNFRLVAATNRDLSQWVREGRFREDLLFRLQAFTIKLPSLLERREDIRELVLYYISRLCDRYGVENKGVAADFIEALSLYDWPGNVRELFQIIEQVFLNPFLGPTCFAVHLPDKFRVLQARAGVSVKKPPHSVAEAIPSWRQYKETCEKEYLVKLKEYSHGNISQSCRTAGLSRTRYYQLLQKHGLSVD
ncbi:sigma-54-dependent transcriptional regulator [Desulfopila aestuarii]|uniref:Two-component system, NtrC family, response regulator n=1 Tax=Desulfopila aestuarii DSM 18488 TaxID=1121416 RepID=A0A1M7Y5X4_9BACT|nr:sigma-54 dependent transcriptional regulator [Desulfopila aestuarii]SHO47969.1 two-component system, NtrC family, response regulator [Desulfopila aestuarii DSM 18488]